MLWRLVVLQGSAVESKLTNLSAQPERSNRPHRGPQRWASNVPYDVSCCRSSVMISVRPFLKHHQALRRGHDRKHPLWTILGPWVRACGRGGECGGVRSPDRISAAAHWYPEIDSDFARGRRELVRRPEYWTTRHFAGDLLDQFAFQPVDV